MSLVESALRDVPSETKAKFLEYHKQNPQIWKAFERYSREALDAKKKVGSMTVVGRVRWEAEFESNGEYKVNNNFAPYYARIFNAKYKTNFFDTREVHG